MFSYKSKQGAKVEEYRSSCPTHKLNSGCRAPNDSLTSLICTTIFEGYGFGLFGKLQRYQLYAIIHSFRLDAGLVVSPVWLCHFRCRLFQWVWRSLTYRKKQPFDKVATENRWPGA